MKVVDISESGVKKIIRAFNSYGVDGLVAKRRTAKYALECYYDTVLRLLHEKGEKR